MLCDAMPNGPQYAIFLMNCWLIEVYKRPMLTSFIRPFRPFPVSFDPRSLIPSPLVPRPPLIKIEIEPETSHQHHLAAP